MSTALIVFLNVFFIAFVLVTVVGLQLWGITSGRETTATTPLEQRARLRGTFERRPHTAAPTARPAARRPRRALDLGA